ncbi:MAG TPA: hypothetical protein DHW70_02635 [Candidatus Atribacteria bacterium]|nr:hypothetical protein [Candidatus Atribacteria bacterium]
MKKGRYLVIGVLIGVLVLMVSVFALGETGSQGQPKAVAYGGEIVPLWDDSGCVSVYCNRSCNLWDTGWRCYTKSIYERYDGSGQGKPIRVTAYADCTVLHFWKSTTSCQTSQTGSGRVTATTTCWIRVLFEGQGWNDGSCSCQEL